MQNYKVYVNNKEVIFENLQKEPSSINFYRFDQLPDSAKIEDIILDFEQDEKQLKLEFLSEHPRELFLLFARSYHPIHAAGGLVCAPEGEMLWIFRNGKWDLPKGKREKNEKSKQCALREVEEETGLKNITILKDMSCTYHTYTENGKRILKTTHWYVMFAKKNTALNPQIEEGIIEVRWIKKSELNMVMSNTYQSIFNLMDTYLNPRK